MTDTRLLSRALSMLGALALLSCTGIIVLAVLGRPIPDVLQNLAVGALAALGALLARGVRSDSTADEDPK